MPIKFFNPYRNPASAAKPRLFSFFSGLCSQPDRLRARIDFFLTRLLIVFLFVLVTVYGARQIIDLDLWLHLKTGELILANKSVPLSDPYSIFLDGKEWINHEWLFQLVSYIFYKRLGADGLIIMQNIMLLGIFGVLFLRGVRDNNHLFVFVALYLTLLACAYRFTIRPDIFSLFFLSVYLSLLKKICEGRRKTAYWLIFTQLIWTNCHGFSFTGPLLVLVFIAGDLLKRIPGLPSGWVQSQKLSNQQIRHLLWIAFAMIAVTFLNPSGIQGAAYPLNVLGQISGKGKMIFSYIQELAKPFTPKTIFNPSVFPFFKVLILTSLFSFRFNFKKLNLTDVILWLIFLGMALLAIRNIAYFAIVSCFVILDNVNIAMEQGKELPRIFAHKKLKVIFAYILMGGLFFFPARTAKTFTEGAVFNYDKYELQSTLWNISETYYPQKAVEFLLSNKFPARMINDFNTGSYLIGKAYPRRQIFIDGRTELYGPDFFADYIALGEGHAQTINKMIESRSIQGFFLSYSDKNLHYGLLRFLSLSPDWICVYLDENVIIFLKDIPENKGLIRQWKVDLENWQPPEAQFLKLGIAYRYPAPYIKRGKLLNELGFIEAAAREADIALDIMPHCADALWIKSDQFFKMKDYRRAFIYLRNSLTFIKGNLRLKTKLAFIYHQLGEDEKAFKILNDIIASYPDYAHGYFAKAKIQEQIDPQNSIELLKKAIKIAPKDPSYRIFLGNLYNRQGDHQKAQTEWEEAFQYDSANAELAIDIKKS